LLRIGHRVPTTGKKRLVSVNTPLSLLWDKGLFYAYILEWNSSNFLNFQKNNFNKVLTIDKIIIDKNVLYGILLNNRGQFLEKIYKNWISFIILLLLYDNGRGSS
jgi:hypothetical protein